MNHPEVRASDADRERVADALRDAAGDGQLSVDELDERLQAAYAARTRGELEPLTADLQARPSGGPAAHGPPSVRPGPGGARWLVAIMGGCDRRGRWRVGPRVTSLNVMGGADLDFNHADFAADETELRVIAIMGGASIRVPEGMRVEVSEFAFMAGNEVLLGEGPHPTSGPVLRIRLFSLMGGTDVRRGLGKRERRRRHLEPPPHV